MKTVIIIDPLSIRGRVVDYDTKRLCATQADIANALGKSSTVIANHVKAGKVEVYQDKYLDILDVLEARKNAFPRGRRPLTCILRKSEVAP